MFVCEELCLYAVCGKVMFVCLGKVEMIFVCNLLCLLIRDDFLLMFP